MEEVLDTSAQPDDLAHPVVCFAASPYQLVSAIRIPLVTESGQPRRIDDEYTRCGTWNLFLLFDPHQGWWHVDVTARRPANDVAEQMRQWVDDHSPTATRITVVLDHVHMHTPVALDAVFPPAEARRIRSTRPLYSTPTHGSWLTMVEVEFAVIRGQCLDQRIAPIATVQRKVAA